MDAAARPKIVVIPAKVVKVSGDKNEVLRVAAYCRVSRDTEEQQGSYESQVSYYTKYISSQEGWIAAGIYADDGISGLTAVKRSDFMRLIEDCESGKIDMIITKSISRFARNLLDCVGYVRKLKKLGVGVMFEEEHFCTLDETAEFILTVLGAVAQQESMNISQHVNAGLQHRYAEGSVRQSCTFFLGYDYDIAKHKLVVNPEQAKVVVRIFDEFLKGRSLREICALLEKDNIPTGTGGHKWNPYSVERILMNEKYVGDAMLQKTFTCDVFEKKRKRNAGERRQYYIFENHEPIISRETYIAAQAELLDRKGTFAMGKCGFRSVVAKPYACSGIMFCEYCGSLFLRKGWKRRTGEQVHAWKCQKKDKEGDSGCIVEKIYEKDLKEYCVEALKKLKNMHIEDMKKPEPLSYPEFRQDHSDSEYQEELKRFAKIRMDHSKTEEMIKFISDYPEEKIPSEADFFIPYFVKKITVNNTGLKFFFYGDVMIEVKRD